MNENCIIEQENRVTSDELLSILEGKERLKSYLFTIFNTSSIGQQGVWIKKYGSFENLCDEVIQNTSLQLFEKQDNLKKESIFYTTLNHLKYNLFNEATSVSLKTTDLTVPINFLTIESPESIYIKHEVAEIKQKGYELLLSHLSEIGLTELEKDLIKYKYYNDIEYSSNELANKLNINVKTLHQKHRRLLFKLREYFIINHDVKKYLNPADAILYRAGWTRKELEYITNNYELLTNQELLSALNSKRHNKIRLFALRDVATKLGLTNSELDYAGTYSIDDILREADQMRFSSDEDNIISKYYGKVDTAKIVYLLNFKRNDKITIEDIDNRYEEVKEIYKERYEKRKKIVKYEYEN